VAATLTEPRVTSWLLGAFAGVALALAALGIYGVLAFAVAGRIPELGLRMALGARRTDVLGLILRQGLTVIAVGLGLGLAASLALGRLLSRWLFEIHAADPLTLTLACVPLAAVALLACWLPARRAARVDPMVALRWE
jgi:putative ABC transport system permease protein